MKMIQYTLATVVLSVSVGSLGAQQSRSEQAPTGQLSQRTPADSSLTKNQTFAKCLTITNQEQVSISRFAKEKSTRDDVKALASTLETAHQACLEELKVIASKAAVEASANSPKLGTNNSSSVDFLQIHQEMADQCLKDSKEMLSKKEGIEFDKCFVGMQVAKHSMMHSSLTVLQRHTSGELQSFIKTNLERNADHLNAAMDLMEKISESTATKTAKNRN